MSFQEARDIGEDSGQDVSVGLPATVTRGFESAAITNVASIDTPAVLIDLSLLEANIAAMARIAADAGVQLRPHAKTHKMAQVARLQLDAGAQGVTVAKLGEAEVMAAEGIRDLLIAYPIVGELKLKRLCRLASENELRVTADSFVVLEGISRAAVKQGLRIKALLEIDSGFGRCGLQSFEQTAALAEEAGRLRGIELCGLLGFAGQGYAARTTEELARIGYEEGASLVDFAERLRTKGVPLEEVSVGSTPTSRYAARVPGVTEIRPGTYVFSDRTQVSLGWGELSGCALTILATIVSRPTATRAVVDVGTKGLTSDPAPSAGFGDVVGRPGAQLATLTEEHGILTLGRDDDLDIGSRVEIIPNHACGALNMFDIAYIRRDEEVLDCWSVAARGKMQ